ncbi:hypothetical protein OIU78_006682 [Salix suchowensis]|nr:hypothetical protein OIU78_006682 [Salix suchowensis]
MACNIFYRQDFVMDQVFVLADDFVIAAEEPNSSYPPSLPMFSLDRHCSHQCQQTWINRIAEH